METSVVVGGSRSVASGVLSAGSGRLRGVSFYGGYACRGVCNLGGGKSH